MGTSLNVQTWTAKKYKGRSYMQCMLRKLPYMIRQWFLEFFTHNHWPTNRLVRHSLKQKVIRTESKVSQLVTVSQLLNLNKHLFSVKSNLTLSPMFRNQASDARCQNHASDVIYCDHASDVKYESSYVGYEWWKSYFDWYLTFTWDFSGDLEIIILSFN